MKQTSAWAIKEIFQPSIFECFFSQWLRISIKLHLNISWKQIVWGRRYLVGVGEDRFPKGSLKLRKSRMFAQECSLSDFSTFKGHHLCLGYIFKKKGSFFRNLVILGLLCISLSDRARIWCRITGSNSCSLLLSSISCFPFLGNEKTWHHLFLYSLMKRENKLDNFNIWVPWIIELYKYKLLLSFKSSPSTRQVARIQTYKYIKKS